MLRRKSLLICLTTVTLCFVGIVPANAVMETYEEEREHHGGSPHDAIGGSAGSYDSYDDAYFVIDCYLDSNGDTWLLLWNWMDDSTLLVPLRLGLNTGKTVY